MIEHWDKVIWERERVCRRQFGRYLTQDQLTILSGASGRMIHRLETLGLIHRIWVNGQEMYRTECLRQIRKILRLRYDLGVSWTSMEIVLRLLDRIDELEQQITDD